MIIRDALAWARRRLASSPTARGDARLLLQHLLGVDHSFLVAHGAKPLNESQVRTFRQWVTRAEQLEPIPYIVGAAPFYGLSFKVTPDVLIPRPETELLVEQSIIWARENQVQHVVDVGTGSGCIATVLARQLRQATVEATDVSAAGLAVARENALRHGVESRITFHRGSLLEPITKTVDLVVANLPYVSDAEWTTLDDGVKWYEPAAALRGGPEGLDLIRQLLHQARSRLQSGGAIFLEIGWRQGPNARDLAQSVFPAARVTVGRDYAGHERIITIETQ